MTHLGVDLLEGFNWFVLGYFLVLNSSYLVLIGLAARVTTRSLRRPDRGSHDDLFANPLTPGVSVVMGAYNEELSIVQVARAALDLRYPLHEVIIVDDGSTDMTFERLRAAFDLVETVPALEDDVVTIGEVRSLHVPRSGEPLVVIRKRNAGRRADALNTGLNAARHPIVCCADGDSILESDALLRMVRPFVDDPDRVVASGGVIRAVNGSTTHRGQLTDVRQPRSWLARIQIVEYLRSFLLGRTGWSQLDALLIISGAFGMYRRDLLVAVGGFDSNSLGEDADLVMAFHRAQRDAGADYRIVHVPDAVCWTEVPSTRASLRRQRRRWSHGLAQVLWKYRGMVGRRRYGRVGLVAVPYYVVFELLGPVIELLGIAALVLALALGVVDHDFALLLAAAAVLYGIALSITALLVEEVSFHRYPRWRDLGVGVVASVLENVGYRQMHAWWRLGGLVSAVRGVEPVWGEMERAGFVQEDGATTRPVTVAPSVAPTAPERMPLPPDPRAPVVVAATAAGRTRVLALLSLAIVASSFRGLRRRDGLPGRSRTIWTEAMMAVFCLGTALYLIAGPDTGARGLDPRAKAPVRAPGGDDPARGDRRDRQGEPDRPITRSHQQRRARTRARRR